ncbi:hypothetical protein [Wenyingzhuangia sp. IMCC45574]
MLNKLIVLTTFFAILSSCERKNEYTLDTAQTIYSIDANLPKVRLDFTLKDSLLEQSIENKHGIDLCKDPYFNGIIEHQNKEYTLPIYLIKTNYCNLFGTCNKDGIEIYLNELDEILIDHERITPEDDPETSGIKTVTNKCRDHFNEDGKRALFFINWTNEWKPESMKKLFLDVREGIHNFYNDFALETYNKSITACTHKEKEQLNKQFHYLVCVSHFPYVIPPPPPPPVDYKDEFILTKEDKGVQNED